MRSVSPKVGLFAVASVLLTICVPLGAPAASAGTGTCSFSVVKAAKPGTYADLVDLTSLAADNVWAVGSDLQRRLQVPLVEHWDGRAWSQVPAPNPGVKGGVLRKVSASSPNDVWAVGTYYTQGKTGNGLVEHWDGNSWSVVQTPRLPRWNDFMGVSADSPSDVWIVGSQGATTPRGFNPVIEHWNGTTWSITRGRERTPDVGTAVDVAARSPTDVWVVGSDERANFIEHWNGSRWRIQFSTSKSYITSVSAVGWAVADRFTESPLTLRRNGTSWVAVPTPHLHARTMDPARISGSRKSNVWLVGRVLIQEEKPLIEHWNGTRWSVVTIPHAPKGSQSDGLLGVTVGSTGQVWAVGSYWNAQRDESIPLVYQRTC